MPILLLVFKILGVLLLILLLAVAAALFVPMRLNFEYRPGRVQLSASYGPLRRTIFSRGAARRRPARPAPERSGQGPVPPSPPVQPAAEPAERAPQQTGPVSESAAPTPGAPSAEALGTDAPEEPPGRAEYILLLAQQQPMALLRCLAGHFRWMRDHAVCKLRVRHLDVFWTVTCEDAADTALAYGAEMAAFNTLLALLQQSVSIQSDQLWLEPDFTGERRRERRVAFSLSACAVLMLGLAYRLWKDPLLQPQQETVHA